LVEDLAIESVKKVLSGCEIGKLNLDIKRYARIEKIPGGTLEESKVLNGVMVNKDIVHPNMRR
jgi:T-complex protein 1 subunit gamma